MKRISEGNKYEKKVILFIRIESKVESTKLRRQEKMQSKK